MTKHAQATRVAVVLKQEALHPDVAILDLSMPRLNGLDAAREIHQVCPLPHLYMSVSRASRAPPELDSAIELYLLESWASMRLPVSSASHRPAPHPPLSPRSPPGD